MWVDCAVVLYTVLCLSSIPINSCLINLYANHNILHHHHHHHTNCVHNNTTTTTTTTTLITVTDPKNADYEMESGGTRNYEVWHDENKTNADFEKQLEEDEKMDSMKALENRVEESQREMAEMDALEEIRAMNQRHVRLMSKGGRRMDVAEAVLKAREAAQQLKMAEEDLNENGLTNDEENLVQSIKFGAAAANNDAVDENGRTTANNNSSSSIRRLDEEDEAFAEKQRRDEADAIMMKQLAAEKRKREEDVDGCSKTKKSGLPVMFKVKRKKKKDATTTTAAPDAKKAKTSDVAVTKKAPPPKDSDSSDSAPGGGALGLLGGYGSTDSD